jgi:two-component sensor histidine kinase
MNTDDLYRLLQTGHAQAQAIVDTVSDPLLVLDASLCVQAANRAFFATFGVDSYETIGQPLYQLGNGQWDIPGLRHLLEDIIPKSSAVINYEVEHDFPGLGPRTMLLTARALQQPGRGSRALLLAIVDATEQHQRDIAKDLLFGELRHRMKNLLGVAQSLVRQTRIEGRSAEEYRDVLSERFTALMEAEDIAFGKTGEAGLNEVLERVFAPYQGGSSAVVIEPGPAVVLSPRTITSLSLILHEMATNAVKYGGLSTPGGEVRVSWHAEDGERSLRLKWRESGGPPVAAPTVAGFGTELIASTITYSLHGQLEQDYAPDGFRAEFVFPVG